MPPGLIIIVQGACNVIQSCITDQGYVDKTNPYKPAWSNAKRKILEERDYRELKRDNNLLTNLEH